MRERVYAHGAADVRLKRRGPLYCRQNKPELTYHGIGFQHRGVSSYAATTTPECCRFGWRNRRKRESRTALISVVYVPISTTKFRRESDSRSSKLVAESKTRNRGIRAVKIYAVSTGISAVTRAATRTPPAAVAAWPTRWAREQHGLSVRERQRQQWPPHTVAAWPTWPRPLRRGCCAVHNPLQPALPPPSVAAGPAASWHGGRFHVSPAAPAVTSEGVLFDNVFDMWSFLAILLARGSF